MASTLPNPVTALVRSELRYQVSRMAIMAIAFLFPFFMVVTVAVSDSGIELDDLIPFTVMLVMFGGMPGFFLLYVQQEAFSVENRAFFLGTLPINEETQIKALYRLTLIELSPTFFVTMVTVLALHIFNPAIPLLYALGISSLIALGVLLAVLVQSMLRSRSYNLSQIVMIIGLFVFIFSLNFMRYLGMDWVSLLSTPWFPVLNLGLILYLARSQARLVMTSKSRR